MAAVAPLPVAATQSQTQEDENEEDDESPLTSLGHLSCDIVGIRYYNGVAHPGEFVRLHREPNNPYDKNAIRIDNMSGIKVGHIKATVAKGLAAVMDQLKQVTIDAIIAGRGNAYTLPLKVEVFGPLASDQEKVNAIFQRFRQHWSLNKALANRRKSAPAVEVVKRSVDWKSAQQNLDDMFEKISKEQLANLPDIPMPAELDAKLLDHQVEGIRWLYKRETEDVAAPFYKQVKEKGNNVWLSEITNSSQVTAPAPIKGSIVADDMGLGKTLQSIGLMLANRPAGQPKMTLIICPISVMSNWVQQIEEHVKADTLKVGLYHGADRYDLLSSDLDVVIASYGTISADYGNEFPKLGGKSSNVKPKKKKARTSKGPSIFAQTFWRIILDEAHIIRNTKSRTFAAVSKLHATYRLCLTGTPLQNKPEDIQSLFSFLGVEPLGDRDIFRRAISQPIQNGEDVGLARLRTMMAHIALRRNKSKLKLVEKVVEVRSIAFPADNPHKGIHDTLFESAQIAFRATLSRGDDKAMKNYMMILETLMRIRQACVSGNLIPKDRLEAAENALAQFKGKQLTAEEGEALLQKLKGAFANEEGVECAICMEDLEEGSSVILRTCKHVFCEPCLSKVSEKCSGLCPLCRQKFEPKDMIKSSAAAAATATGTENPKLSAIENLGPSPKLEALGQAIAEMKADEKGVCFSQFTKFLDVIEPYLTAQGHTFVRIDGSKSAKQRLNALKEFSAEDGPRFILCSLHAAGTGITLNRANHAFMMDTWWNVSVENQAMDRIHRIGQTRNVRIVRFVMKDSIEERMITLQEAKAAIGKGAMEKLKPDEVRKARISNLKSLFSIADQTSA